MFDNALRVCCDVCMKCKICESENVVKNGKRKGTQSELLHREIAKEILVDFQYGRSSVQFELPHSRLSFYDFRGRPLIGPKDISPLELQCPYLDGFGLMPRNITKSRCPKAVLRLNLTKGIMLSGQKNNCGFGKYIVEQPDNLLAGNAAKIQCEDLLR